MDAEESAADPTGGGLTGDGRRSEPTICTAAGEMDAPAAAGSAEGPRDCPAGRGTRQTMNNIDGVHPAWAPRPVEPTNPALPSGPTQPVGDVSDVVEISTAAELAARIQEVPEVRAELVARVKREIEAGTYETSERIDAAVERLLDELFPELL